MTEHDTTPCPLGINWSMDGPEPGGNPGEMPDQPPVGIPKSHLERPYERPSDEGKSPAELGVYSDNL